MNKSKKIKCCRLINWFIMIVFIGMLLTGCSPRSNYVDYKSAENWAYFGIGKEKAVDVFLIAPTVYMSTDQNHNMSLEDEDTKELFIGALNMERGIYDSTCRLYAPFYQQVGLEVYEMDEEESSQYKNYAYEDIYQAFLYYMKYYNEGRPIVLAGFSQGAEMGFRLMKDCFAIPEYKEKLIAAYLLGWSYTSMDVLEYPQLCPAQAADDTGVIISFNSEAEFVEDSLFVPEGEKTLAINPLNWKTDSSQALPEKNIGACFTNYQAEVIEEIPEFCGAYLDEKRGTLKVTGISPEKYQSDLKIIDKGVYHLYDYQFFYRNLQDNVNLRVKRYLDALNPVNN